MRLSLSMVSVLLVLATLASGCVSFGSALGRPRALFEDAQAEIARGDLETAYAHLKQIAIRYPDSSESDEAFPLAASCLRMLYHAHRYRDRNSVWLTSEPAFMFEWLARYFGAEFPVGPVNALFVGLPYQVLREFQAYAQTHPKLSGWILQAEDDNGIVQSVTAARAETRAR